jgi:hypothetical protein
MSAFNIDAGTPLLLQLQVTQYQNFSHFPKNNEKNIKTIIFVKCVPNFAGPEVHECFLSLSFR